MKRIACAIIMLVMMSAVSWSQDKDKDKKGQEYKLTSEVLQKEGQNLDNRITDIGKKIAEIIKNYDLLKAPVRIIPYQTNFVQGNDYIELEKHSFMKDDTYARDITGIQVKKIKIYTNGQTCLLYTSPSPRDS